MKRENHAHEKQGLWTVRIKNRLRPMKFREYTASLDEICKDVASGKMCEATTTICPPGDEAFRRIDEISELSTLISAPHRPSNALMKQRSSVSHSNDTNRNDINHSSANKIKVKDDNRKILITNSNFQLEVIQSKKPIIVHCSFGNEYDSQLIPVLHKLSQQYSNTVRFGEVKISDEASIVAKYGVLMAPTLLIFTYGKVVEQIIGAVDKDTISKKLDTVLGKAEEELQERSLNDLKKAYEPYSKTNTGEWSLAFVSGLVSGIVFAMARSHLEGAASLIVPGFAYVFFIQNKNMSFSGLQKVFATGLMLVIGTSWKEILQSMT